MEEHLLNEYCPLDAAPRSDDQRKCDASCEDGQFGLVVETGDVGSQREYDSVHEQAQCNVEVKYGVAVNFINVFPLDESFGKAGFDDRCGDVDEYSGKGDQPKLFWRQQSCENDGDDK